MKVQGTMEVVKPLEFDGYLWRVRTNIERVTKEDMDGGQYEVWEYDEEILTNKELEERLDEGRK